MDFLKKHPLFVASITICALVFAFGAWLLIGSVRAADDASSARERAERDARNAFTAEIAPTRENLERVEANLTTLREQLVEIRKRLETGRSLETTTDPVQVIARIQRYISGLRSTAEEAGVRFSANFGFGFDRYVEGSTPPAAEFVSRVDKQRLILDFLMRELINASPNSIVAVQRELIEVPPATGTNRQTGGTTGDRSAGTTGRQTGAGAQQFTIDPAVSARVPGAIDTLAFRVTFTGLTESLQTYLNVLSQFELPIVVRSVQVSRPAAAPAASGRARPRQQTIEDLFGGFGGGTPAATPAPNLGAEQRPVIEDNESQFTLVLEFVQVVVAANAMPDVSEVSF